MGSLYFEPKNSFPRLSNSWPTFVKIAVLLVMQQPAVTRKEIYVHIISFSLGILKNNLKFHIYVRYHSYIIHTTTTTKP